MLFSPWWKSCSPTGLTGRTGSFWTSLLDPSRMFSTKNPTNCRCMANGGLGGLWELWGVRGVVGMAGKVFGGCLSAVGGWRVATGPFTSGGITVVKCANNLWILLCATWLSCRPQYVRRHRFPNSCGTELLVWKLFTAVSNTTILALQSSSIAVLLLLLFWWRRTSG